jgi:hypothetical protein
MYTRYIWNTIHTSSLRLWENNKHSDFGNIDVFCQQLSFYFLLKVIYFYVLNYLFIYTTWYITKWLRHYATNLKVNF